MSGTAPGGAYTVTEGIAPAGEITAHTPVTVPYKIHFTGSSLKELFPASDTLMLDTDLEDAVWTWELVVEGTENQRPLVRGKTLELSGFELSYPSRYNEFIILRLDGIAPNVPATEARNLMRIRQVDRNGATVRESIYRHMVFPLRAVIPAIPFFYA